MTTSRLKKTILTTAAVAGFATLAWTDKAYAEPPMRCDRIECTSTDPSSCSRIENVAVSTAATSNAFKSAMQCFKQGSYSCHLGHQTCHEWIPLPNPQLDAELIKSFLQKEENEGDLVFIAGFLAFCTLPFLPMFIGACAADYTAKKRAKKNPGKADSLGQGGVGLNM